MPETRETNLRLPWPRAGLQDVQEFLPLGRRGVQAVHQKPMHQRRPLPTPAACAAVEDDMTNQCQHGQLARVCELCAKDAEIAALQAEVANLTKIIDEAWGDA